jgi:hypothetical protein
MPQAGRLHLSKDRKVSPRGSWAGMHKGRDRGFVSTLANSFGLPAGGSCPGATGFCVSCYAINAERYSPNTAAAMQHNFDLLLACDGNVNAMRDLLLEALERFRRSFDHTGLPEKDRIFRIHWDGDFFSESYALAWKRAMLANDDVDFWTYTRSINDDCNVVPILEGVGNLALYISTDEWNWARAHELATRYDVRLALVADDFRRGRELRHDSELGQRAIVCPENKGLLPLMNDDGRGACAECRLCIIGHRDIIFSATKVEDTEAGQGRLFKTGPFQVPVAIRSRKR